MRFRIALDGDRFRWKSGTKPCLYGLHRLAEAQKAGQVVLVEGESDCHTLWFHGPRRLAYRAPPIGARSVTPGTWMGLRQSTSSSSLIAAAMPCGNGYRVPQFDTGRNWSVCRRRTHRHCTSKAPPEFKRRWQVACLGAVPWMAVEAKASAEEHSEAWEKCSGLAQKPTFSITLRLTYRYWRRR